MKELVGRKIIGIFPKSECIIFDTDKGGLSYTVEGDCCSYSWFESIQGVDALLLGTVTEVEELFIDSWTDETDELIQSYGFKIKTNKGYATIEFRNSSNGYYGGWCNPGSTCDAPQIPSIQDDWNN